MMKKILSAIAIINSIGLINGQPVTTDMFGLTGLSSTIEEGDSSMPKYVIDYFEVSSSLLVPNAYPIDVCTLNSLVSEYSYVRYTCATGNNLVLKEYFTDSDCGTESLNASLREEIRSDSSLEDGDYSTFNCNGLYDTYVSIKSCSTNTDLLVVPNICFFDTGSGDTKAYQWGCADTNNDNDFDKVWLYTYDLDDDTPRTSCTSNTVSSKSLSLSSSTCTTIFQGFTGYVVKDDSECPVVEEEPDENAAFITAPIIFSMIIIAISFVIII